jgi:hypothetical protein
METNNKTGYIYSLKCEEQDLYVGYAQVPQEARLKTHLYMLSRGKHWNNKLKEAYSSNKEITIHVLENIEKLNMKNARKQWKARLLK